MPAEPHHRVSFEEYLATERRSETKSELDATVPLHSIGCMLRLAEVYDRVPGPAEPPAG